MSKPQTWGGWVADSAVSRLEDAHCGLILAVRAACALLEDNNVVEAGALRCAESAIAEAIADLRGLAARHGEAPKPD